MKNSRVKESNRNALIESVTGKWRLLSTLVKMFPDETSETIVGELTFQGAETAKLDKKPLREDSLVIFRIPSLFDSVDGIKSPKEDIEEPPKPSAPPVIFE